MKVLSKKIENREAFLTIELEPAEVEEAMEKTYKKLAETTAVPGFRKGKAPRSVLEQQIGKDKFIEDSLNSLMPEAYKSAIKEQDIKPIAEPYIKLTQKEPLTFEANVPLEPIVKIGDYNKIKMKPEKVKIKEEEINNVIEELRKRSATYKPVERPVQVNDMVTIDVEGVIDGKTIFDEKATDYQIISGMGFPATGFPEKLLKMEMGKEKKFNLKLSKNYNEKELAEKEVLFKVKIIEIKEMVLPEINDDFAKSNVPDIKNIDELKERIKNDLKSNAEEKAKFDFEDKVIEALVEKSELEYHSIMVDTEVNYMINQHMQQLGMSARDKDHFEKMMENMPREELQDEYRPLAVKRVSGCLVLDKVSEAENIEVSDAEIDSEIEMMIQDAGAKKAEQKNYYNTPHSKGYIKKVITARKAVQRLVDIAQSTKKKITKQEEVK
ncbi:MAG: trigger factor [Chloroflexota bacterium]